MKNAETLNNKMLFIEHQNNSVHSVKFSVSFRIGSAYENDSNRGISHLVEHLFFRRLKDISKSDLCTKLNSMGTELVASTSYDYTEFSITVVPEYSSEIFYIINKLLDDFSWSSEEIRLEKNIVIKQLENKSDSYSEWLNKIYCEGTGYKNSIMGSVDSVSSLTDDTINNWKKSYYSACNACFVVTGNYQSDDLLKWRSVLSEKEPIGLMQNTLCKLPVGFGERTKNNRYFVIPNDNNKYSDVTIMFDVDESIDYEVMRLLTSMVGEGYFSLLSNCLREIHFLTDDVFTEFVCFNGFYRVSFSFRINTEDILRGIKLFMEVISDTNDPLYSALMEQSIKFFTCNHLQDYDDIINLNHNYVICDFVLQHIVSEPTDKKNKYEQIVLSDLIDCSKNVFCSRNLSMVIETNYKSDKLIGEIEKAIKKQGTVLCLDR